MQWDLVEDGFDFGIVTKFAFYLFVIATIVLINFIIVTVRDSWRMKQQLRLWLERGEQPPQPIFISAEDWAAMMPLQWSNLAVWEHFFDLWVRPQFDLSRKAKAWAIFSILVGLASTVFELMDYFRVIGVVGIAHIGNILIVISEKLIPLLFALGIGLSFHLLAVWADSRIANWKKRMHDSIKKTVSAQEPAGRLP